VDEAETRAAPAARSPVAEMYGVLLLCHVTGGAVSLLSAAVAIATTKGARGHVYAGRVFVLAMALVFVTAVPMTIIRPNPFLLVVAVFSFYLALTGWLRARNRSGMPVLADWIATVAMGVTAVAMAVMGLLMVAAGSMLGIVLLAFALIGGGLAASEVPFLRGRRYRGAERIVAHLGRMLGGTIAALTAFLVVNVRVVPAFLVFLAPTVLLTPLIFYWAARVGRAAERG
jgi:hypothetical protein